MASPDGSAELLAGAIRYALGSLSHVTPGCLSRPTPCAAWDLAALLQHVDDSLAALHDGIATGYVSVSPGPAAHSAVSSAPVSSAPVDSAGVSSAANSSAVGPAGRLITALRHRAGQLLVAATSGGGLDRPVAIADRRLAGSRLAAVGAVEIAVHGWDITETCGRRRPIPPALAAGILTIVPGVVTSDIRDVRFAAPVLASPHASPSDRLVALLGRNPAGGGWCPPA
jgi:uncharacterized protein (TIGR03083 family)